MMMGIRAWWWGRVRGNPEDMPREVREYIIRRYLKASVDAAKTNEEKTTFSKSLMSSALALDEDQIGADLRDELIAASFKLLDGVPRTKCAICGGAVFVHEGISIGGSVYCKPCAETVAH
jgi:hypothetical protein